RSNSVSQRMSAGAPHRPYRATSRVSESAPVSSHSRILFVIAAAFLLLAPITTRSDASEFSYGLKWARIGLSVLAVIIGTRGFQWNRIGRSVRLLLAFSVIFVCGAFWSTSPTLGLLNKGMFLAAFCAGVLLATSLSSLNELRKGLRIIAVAGTCGGLVIFAESVLHPEQSHVFGRLAPFGMNANSLGQAGAVFIILILSLATIETDRRRQFVLLICTAMMAWIIVQTGSRGAFVMAALGSSLVLLGFMRGKVELIVLSLLAAGFFATLYMMISTEHFDGGTLYPASIRDADTIRLSRELFKDTRSQVWRLTLERWSEHPIQGIGWWNARGRSLSVMNIYLQVLLETGLIGATFFFVCIVAVIRSGIKTLRLQKHWSRHMRSLAWLTLGCTFGLLIHGMAESSTLLGTTSNSLVFGMSVTLLARLPNLAQPQRLNS
ncbi:MAG: hypothetical protein ABGZ35_00795, partial [Planctomycetaceae bacterium]